MLIDGQFSVAAPPAQVLAHLFDARLMASCLPGCESLEALDPDRYRAVVGVALAGVKARFDLLVEVTGRDPDGIRALTRGEEGGNASTLQATSEVRLAAVPEGTRVDYRSEVAVTGRLGRFALGMMKKKAQSLGDEFAANLQAQLAATPATRQQVIDPVAAIAVVDRAGVALQGDAPSGLSAWQRFVRWLRRVFGRDAPAARAPH
jgi:carbon monoxide dehydrogenase subunit G